MPKGKSQFQMTKVITKVKVNAASTGNGPYKVEDLPLTELEVFGTEYVDFGDGSGVACFLVLNERNTLTPRAMRNFEVIDWKEE